MAITTSEIVTNELQPDGTRIVRFKYTFDTGKVVYYGPTTVPGATDVSALMTSLIPGVELETAIDEVNTQVTVAEAGGNPDKVPPEYQTQVDFDRRLLGRMMLVRDIHQFHASYPFFQAMELRNGANANQRATNLGVSSTEYGEVETRYNNVSGISWALSDIENDIWQELPDDWQ